MTRVTRRQARAWLAPMRSCFAQIRATGSADSIRGYAVTRLHSSDDYARIDWCIAGFRALIARLCPDLDCGPLERVEKRLAAGAPMTVGDIDAALALLHRCEDALIRHTVFDLKDAVLTEQIAIEMERMEDAA